MANAYLTDSNGTSTSPTVLAQARKPITLHQLQAMGQQGTKITMLTAYDATFARLLDECGVDCLLVGDSLGMVCQGQPTTVPVSLHDMIYHTQAVCRGNRTAWVIADLPFGSYQLGREQALQSSMALLQAGAQMVKLEGGGWTTETVRFLVERGVPVCAHLGLTPQSVHALGGYKVQGRNQHEAEMIRQQAKELTEAGAQMMVLELMPTSLAAQIHIDNPYLLTIGIGAGAQVAGQVLVVYDMLRLTRGKLPRFARDFMAEGGSIEEAIGRYVAAVKNGSYPDPTQHGY